MSNPLWKKPEPLKVSYRKPTSCVFVEIGGKQPAGLEFIALILGIHQSIGPAVAGWIKDITVTFAGAFILSAVVSLLGAAGPRCPERSPKSNAERVRQQETFILVNWKT